MTLWHIPLLLLFLFFLIALLNAATFPRLGREGNQSSPMISIIVPARNEEGVIAQSVHQLLGQQYPDFEVIVIDDQSEDATSEIAFRAGQGNYRLQVITGQELPPGWTGKNWACYQASKAARGDWLVFTDADVQWKPHALQALAACMQYNQADLLSVWPTQKTISWAERLVVPMMMFAVMAYLPELAVRYLPWKVFSAANGQCLAFKREVYEAIGGHQAVRSSVLDDMNLAWKTKGAGKRLVQALGNQLLTTRMYTNWETVRSGFAKNILAGHGGRISFLLLSTFVHWILFVIPWVWLLFGWMIPWLKGSWPLIPAVLIGLALGARLISAAASRDNLIDVLLLPLSVLLLTLIAFQAISWHMQKSATWKGRPVLNHE